MTPACLPPCLFHPSYWLPLTTLLSHWLLRSVGDSWRSSAGVDAASQGTQDVKELIPELFYCPDLLLNGNRFHFGTAQVLQGGGVVCVCV